MKLTPNYVIRSDTRGYETIAYSLIKFPSGELQVTLNAVDTEQVMEITEVSIEGSILNSDNLMELCQLVEALRRHIPPLVKLALVLPYCAYSRQDRVCNKGESFSLKVFTNIINSLNFALVITVDNHSDVSTALLNNCINIPVHDILSDNELDNFTYLISPDAGANKKVQECAKALNTPMLRADKIRNTQTGEILETIIYATPKQLKNSTVLIVDDICANGRTFTELAKAIHKIEPTCTVCLYVTHGFFSKGLEPLFDSEIDHIYTTNTVCTLTAKNLTVLSL